MSSGFLTEKEITELCNSMFIEDFVLSNLSFDKPGTGAKEIADLILKFDNDLICFQIKRKNDVKEAKNTTETDFKRVEKRIIKAVGQLASTYKYLKRDKHSIKNIHGVEQNLHITEATKLHGIVILHLVGHETLSPDERLAIYNRFTSIQNIPVHIFLKEDFELLTSAVDTLPDFLNYLQYREKICKSGKLSAFTNEADLIGLFILDKGMIEKIINENNTFLTIEGFEEEFRRMQGDIKRSCKESYLIDQIIRHQHAAIGFDDFSRISGPNIFSQNATAYIGAATELAKFNREQRQVIAQAILNGCQISAVSKKDSFGFIQFTKKNEAILIMTSFLEDRQQRANKLSFYATALYCHLKLTKLIAIATEAIFGSEISEDIIIYHDVNIENCHDYLANAANWLNYFDKNIMPQLK